MVGQKEVFSGEVFSEAQSVLPETSSLEEIGVIFAGRQTKMNKILIFLSEQESERIPIVTSHALHSREWNRRSGSPTSLRTAEI